MLLKRKYNIDCVVLNVAWHYYLFKTIFLYIRSTNTWVPKDNIIPFKGYRIKNLH